ncbi:hypothetical protein NKDENANG_04090 [Candidatus Entotheonellaceae bacterium PAL068K]
MYRSTTKLRIAALLAVCLLLVAGLAQAQNMRRSEVPSESKEPNAGEMLIDIIFLRPLGLAGTALGVAAYVISLPITLPTKRAKTAGQKLVLDPAKYTFTRPLGHI